VNPSLEIIRELAARGTRVTYANDPSYAKIVEAAGAELVPHGSTLPFYSDAPWAGDAIQGIALFLDDAIAMLPQLRKPCSGISRAGTWCCRSARTCTRRISGRCRRRSRCTRGWPSS